MSRRFVLILSGVLALFTVSLIWQFAETDVQLAAEKVWGFLTGKPINQTSSKDLSGLPMQRYSDGKKHYNPLFISRDAKEAFFLRDDPKMQKRFIQYTDWLLQHAVETDSTLDIYYEFDYPKYGQKEPWQSALAQASLMNALLQRAGYERDLDIYTKAYKALNSLRPELGKVAVALNDSSYWYMEYPAEEPYFSLSGMITTLLELNYYYKKTEDPLALELFEKGYNSVIYLIPLYDFGGGYTYYNLKGVKSGRMYHQKLVKRVEALNKLKPANELRYYADRWTMADSYPVLWQLIRNPKPKRILLFSFTFILLWTGYFLLLGGAHNKAKDALAYS
ncbi:MAG: D-glucuronyl C5-epimerase family protein [Candidatus Cloacimonetes bacterium]|nr:D-glucuronyl C5-epimerase family protein [Candidatus Cloacimonadota bacterium]